MIPFWNLSCPALPLSYLRQYVGPYPFSPACGFVCFLNDFFICKGIDEADHAKDIT